MLIDWFTVIAQIINFLVLVFLLQRFLYQPIRQAMQARQQKIDSYWQEAERQQGEAKLAAASYRQQQQALEQQREKWQLAMREEVESQRQQLLVQVREEVEQKSAAWRQALGQEQAQFLQNLRGQIAQQTWQIARQALRDLANADLEQQLLAVLVERLGQLKGGEREAIAQSLAQSEQAIAVRSRFPLSLQGQQTLRELLQEQFGRQVGVQFSTSPTPLCGFEVRLGGYEIAWNLQDYINTLEERLARAIEQETGLKDEPRQQDTASRSG